MKWDVSTKTNSYFECWLWIRVTTAITVFVILILCMVNINMPFCTYDKVYSEVICSKSLSLVRNRQQEWTQVPWLGSLCSLYYNCYYSNIYRGQWGSSQYCTVLTEAQPWNLEAGRDLRNQWTPTPLSGHDSHSVFSHLSLILLSQSVSEDLCLLQCPLQYELQCRFLSPVLDTLN